MRGVDFFFEMSFSSCEIGQYGAQGERRPVDAIGELLTARAGRRKERRWIWERFSRMKVSGCARKQGRRADLVHCCSDWIILG